MASRIQELLTAIKTAVYGEEVRGSIHDSIEQCYTDISSAKTLADDATAYARSAGDSAVEKAALADRFSYRNGQCGGGGLQDGDRKRHYCNDKRKCR